MGLGGVDAPVVDCALTFFCRDQENSTLVGPKCPGTEVSGYRLGLGYFVKVFRISTGIGLLVELYS